MKAPLGASKRGQANGFERITLLVDATNKIT